MIIGIDLDNTIINYEYAFKEGLKYLNINLPENLKSKNEIRNFLRSLNDGEFHWQKLQGIVYGKLLNNYGRLYNGVSRFIWRSFFAGFKIKIISHKTEFGHFDEDKIPLREAALKFLENNSLFPNKTVEQVVFKDTFQEKIDEIKKSSCTVFIDDLVEVITNISPFIPQSYLFSSENFGLNFESKNWSQLDSEINGSWKISEIIKITEDFIGESPINVEQIKNGGNSGVYKLNFKHKKSLILKIYSVEGNRNSLNTEFNSLKFLQDLGIHNIPNPVLKNEALGIAFYNCIEGIKITEYSEHDIDSCIKFIHRINHLKNKFNVNTNYISNASDACFSAIEIEKHIEKRLSLFISPKNNNLKLNLFLNNEYNPIWKKILSYIKLNWNSSIDFNEDISQDDKILSPSDFGFHNALKNNKNVIYFLDFEYFGWDDPLKLACDFYIHPGMNLNKHLGMYWIKNFFENFNQSHFKRFQLIKFLYWMTWPLITLNDFRDDVWLRRRLSLNYQVNRQDILTFQLNKSRNLLIQINETFKEEIENA